MLNRQIIKHNIRALLATRHGMFFLLVLMIKVIAAVLVKPELNTQWFIPFIKSFVNSGYQNPWDTFLSANGSVKAFPYGTGMLLIFAGPFSLKALVAGVSSDVISRMDVFLFKLPLIAADIGILYVLVRILQLDAWKSIFIYWCSPVVFYIIYVHGQLDVIPMMLMFASIVTLINNRYLPSALILGFGLASKENLFFAVPFFLVYIFRKENDWIKAGVYLLIAAAAYGLLIGVVFFSHGYQLMVLGAEERTWVMLSKITVGNFQIYLVPLAVAFLYLKFSRYNKVNNEILIMYIGIGFTILLLLIPSSAPGWYMWLVPFICYYFLSMRRSHNFLLFLFSGLFFSFFLLKVPYPLNMIDPNLKSVFQNLTDGLLSDSQMKILIDLNFTFLQGTIAYIAFNMYVHGVRSNRIYKERKTPIIMGISGNSGAGKDTLCNSLKGLLGNDNILQADGDDHHRWERGHHMWKAYTHLHPKANDLFLQFDNTRSLKSGMSVSRRFYNHETGTFTEPQPVRASKYIFISGLHSFYLRNMRELIDIKIFLDTEEQLRNLWKLKRDSEQRGHSKERVLESIKAREEDGSKYIEPQKEFADLLICYEPCRPPDGYGISNTIELKVSFCLDNSINLEGLAVGLGALPSLKVIHSYDDMNRQSLSVQGEIFPKQLREIALQTIPNLDEIIIPQARFEEGLKGIVQIMVLCMISHVKTYDKL
ncbi:MAG: hypothetical protein C4560_08615 [Nitrospiraceae bacterium]|nr:MAG: hypothetical protein C4560_08615 [Nitrospiraceae bacterium]